MPLRTRQSARRPRYGEASRLVTSACSGCPSSYEGARHGVEDRLEERLEIARRAGRGRASPGRRARSCRRSGTRSASRRRRGRGTARRPRRRPRRCARPGRSILLTTRITGSCSSSALRSTKRVWGSGPSLASTSSSTPSTIVRPRSTSPPKSAWPGVSMMLIFVPPWRTAVFLARIVMPFSRSRSPESMTRSCTASFSRKAPDCHSIASTSVVLPWSTWAMIATLRMSARSATPAVSATCPSGRQRLSRERRS